MIVKNYIIDPGQTQLLRRYKTERQHNDKRTSNTFLKIYLSLYATLPSSTSKVNEMSKKNVQKTLK